MAAPADEPAAAVAEPSPPPPAPKPPMESPMEGKAMEGVAMEGVGLGLEVGWDFSPGSVVTAGTRGGVPPRRATPSPPRAAPLPGTRAYEGRGGLSRSRSHESEVEDPVACVQQ